MFRAPLCPSSGALEYYTSVRPGAFDFRNFQPRYEAFMATQFSRVNSCVRTCDCRHGWWEHSPDHTFTRLKIQENCNGSCNYKMYSDEMDTACKVVCKQSFWRWRDTPLGIFCSILFIISHFLQKHSNTKTGSICFIGSKRNLLQPKNDSPDDGSREYFWNVYKSLRR
jgi:hypothetical protein